MDPRASTRIQICGRLVVVWHGERVEQRLPRRQGRLLFAFLVVHRHRPKSRAALVDAVWPVEPPGAPDSALNALLSKLRTVLGREVAMPASARTAQLLVDTSVAVALTVADHEHHGPTVEAVGRRRLGLAGHAAFETFSVLTRLPPPARRSPAAVARLLAASFPHSVFPGARAARALLADLETGGIAGGAVYDALVGATANEHRLTLATRDRRALEVYRALGVDLVLLD